MSIKSDHIVWTNGPFPAGKFADITIFRCGLKQLLEEAEERCEADDGYRGEPLTIELPDEGCYHGGQAQRDLKKRIRSRHETVNGRFKKFGCLDQKFRHQLKYHRFVFNAVVSIVQIQLQYSDNELFQAHGYMTEVI